MGMLLARCFPFGSSAQLLFACHVFALMVRFVSMNIQFYCTHGFQGTIYSISRCQRFFLLQTQQQCGRIIFLLHCCFMICVVFLCTASKSYLKCLFYIMDNSIIMMLSIFWGHNLSVSVGDLIVVHIILVYLHHCNKTKKNVDYG